MAIETRKQFLEIVMREAKLESLEQADASAKAVISLTKTIIGEELSKMIARDLSSGPAGRLGVDQGLSCGCF